MECASEIWTGVMSACDSLESLKAIINLPAELVPWNLETILFSIKVCVGSSGTPLLKLINAAGAKEFWTLFTWKFATSSSISLKLIPDI